VTIKIDEIAYFGNTELLNYIQGPLTLSEMENDYALDNTEWDVLKKYKLSTRQKECMYLYYWGYEGNKPMTQHEIAICFGICRRSVRTHLKRALKKIKRKMMDG